jgi:hypothetical protein
MGAVSQSARDLVPHLAAEPCRYDKIVATFPLSSRARIVAAPARIEASRAHA